MKKIIGVLFVILLFITSESKAYEPSEGRVTGTFGPYFTKTNFGGSGNLKSPAVMNGFGLIALGDISSHGSLEIATFVIPKVYIREDGGRYLEEKTQIVQITMGYRYWINPYFSTSLSFYSAYSTGKVGIKHNDFSPGDTIDTSARDVTEYGFDWALQGDLWNYDRYAVSLEGRYSRSVTSKSHEFGDHYGAMIGLRYLIQEDKVKISPPKEP